MESFLDILSQAWNFLNSYWFPLLLAIIGIIILGVVYFKANQIADKYREEVQQKIVDDAYADHSKKEQDKRN